VALGEAGLGVEVLPGGEHVLKTREEHHAHERLDHLQALFQEQRTDERCTQRTTRYDTHAYRTCTAQACRVREEAQGGNGGDGVVRAPSTQSAIMLSVTPVCSLVLGR
jgi:hypothetical protein